MGGLSLELLVRNVDTIGLEMSFGVAVILPILAGVGAKMLLGGGWQVMFLSGIMFLLVMFVLATMDMDKMHKDKQKRKG